MSPCPECGGAAIRQGTKARRVLDLGPDGTPSLGATRVQRWQCVVCGLFFSTGVDAARPRSLATVAVRDAVAEACFAAGYVAAAARYGVDEKTAKALWCEWAAPRERDIPDRAPEFLGLHTVLIAGSERTLVTDVAAMAVVDVLRGASGADLEAWFASIGRLERVDTVALSVNPAFRAAVRARLPRARLVVCPAHASASGLRAFLHALRALRRWLGHGAVRNVQEAPRLFARPAVALTPAERAEMAAWDDSVLALYAAKERFHAALGTPDAGTARRGLEEAAQACARLLGSASGPAAFLNTWGAEIADGVPLAPLPDFAAALSEAAGAWAARRPVLCFDLARGLAVLRDGQRVIRPDPWNEEEEEVCGVALADVVRALRAPAALAA